MIDTFTPLGVGSEYSWMRSGCCAGHFPVIGKEDKSVMGILFSAHELGRLRRCRLQGGGCRLLAIEGALQRLVEHRADLRVVLDLERTGRYRRLLIVDRHQVAPIAQLAVVAVARGRERLLGKRQEA